MKIGVLRIGQVDSDTTKRIQESISTILTQSTCTVIDGEIPLPEKAFNKTREQHRSDVILGKVRSYAEKSRFDRVLGVADVDVFVLNLNFVFGQADCNGKAALISLWRLRPEYYGDLPNEQLFHERSVKEAVHELGHTFGLEHCSNVFCVMHFSTSIYETDVKHSLFCRRCSVKAEAAITGLGKNLERQV
ncbi:MAG: archaemetzincin family Zn-dependent metalloprotease [Candidatus Bathyarchaeia archaeon]|jgi:archaemetzincin